VIVRLQQKEGAVAVWDRLDARPVAVSPVQRSMFALDSNDLHCAPMSLCLLLWRMSAHWSALGVKAIVICST
jgi:hypothetical protein